MLTAGSAHYFASFATSIDATPGQNHSIILARSTWLEVKGAMSTEIISSTTSPDGEFADAWRSIKSSVTKSDCRQGRVAMVVRQASHSGPCRRTGFVANRNARKARQRSRGTRQEVAADPGQVSPSRSTRTRSRILTGKPTRVTNCSSDFFFFFALPRYRQEGLPSALDEVETIERRSAQIGQSKRRAPRIRCGLAGVDALTLTQEHPDLAADQL